MNAVVGKEVIDLNNNSGDLGKAESISNVTGRGRRVFDAMEEQDWLISNIPQESTDILEGQEKFFDCRAAGFDIPLSIFHYKDYNSDFFTSWYNISSRIFKEINQACPEKQALNLALSVLMFPYIVFTALGLVVYNKLKTNGKTQISSEENKTKKSEVSESTAKRLAYGVLAAVAILVSIPIFLLLLIPATPALVTFYLFNRKLSHSLIDVLKISSGSYQNEHQNIEVSFREIDAGKSDIKWDMEVKFPPQFEQLLRDLYEDKDGSWFNVARDSEHNTILKLSANINLKNGLRSLCNEIKNVLATSIQEFAKTMEELMKLEKKDITYDKLKELLNEFRLKVVDSIGPKLTSHLIQNAYRVAFIQAIKFAQKRKGDFSLEDTLRDIFVKQELESQGKELPTEKEIIVKDLEELIAKSTSWSSVFKSYVDWTQGMLPGQGSKSQKKALKDLSDNEFLVPKAIWKQLMEKNKRTVIDIYKDIYPQETEKALSKAEVMIEKLKGVKEEKYDKIHEKLKEVHENSKNGNLKDGALKRKLEDLFKFEYDDQEVERRLIDSKIRAIRALLSNKLDDKVKQSLTEELDKLKQKQTKIPSEVNDFIEKVYLKINELKMQSLFDTQKGGMESLCDTLKLLKQDDQNLVEMIISYQEEVGKHLTKPAELKEIIEKHNKNLEVKKNNKEKETPSMKLIELCLKNNQEILEALEQLESDKKESLINEEAKNNYREELESREKIKFAVIENELLEVLKKENFDEAEIKRLLEKAELEYCLAEKCIKYPVIKTKDNIKHFCQGLLSPLVDRLANLIINNVPKDNESGLWRFWNSLKVGVNYNVIGWSATVNKDNSTEGKALSVAHDTHKEVETFLQYFKLSYEEVGGLVGDVFSDNGETFKKDIWPKVEEHLRGMWDRFFKDIEFNIGNRLDEVSVTQQRQETVITA